MKRRKKRVKNTRKKRLRIIFAGLSFLTILSLPVVNVYATESKWKNIIYPGVYVEEVNIGGKSLEEAKRLIKEKYEERMISKGIKIIAGDKTYSLNYSQLDPEYNIEEIIKEAFNYGKDENVFLKYFLIKSGKKKEYKLSFKYDEEAIKGLIDQIEQEVNSEGENPKVSIEFGKVNITEGTNGAKIKRDELKEAILKKINNGLSEEVVELEAPIETTKPAIDKDQLQLLNKKISSFNTNFSSSNGNRSNNIQLATEAINGTILMPGDSFSFNDIVGERTRERGYKDAGVIIGDSVQSGLGGGICQVSSTLYNAMLRAGIKPTERRNHTLVLSYVPIGLDATVDWGNIDYKFTNTLSYPIYIEGYTENKNVYFNIYSNEELSGYTYEITTDVYETIKPKIKYVDSKELLEGETKVVKSGTTGYRVKVYRKTYENGNLINTELISNDYYYPVDGQALRGTKKVTPQEEVKNEPLDTEEKQEEVVTEEKKQEVDVEVKQQEIEEVKDDAKIDNQDINVNVDEQSSDLSE